MLLRHITAACAAAAISITAASAQNTQVISSLNLGPDVHDMWVHGNHAYVTRGENGVDVIDVSNQAAPVRVANIQPYPGMLNTHVADVEVVDNIAYLGSEVPNGSSTPWTGVFMYDVSTPAAPALLGTITWGAGGGYHFGANIHGLHIDKRGNNVYCYVASITTSTVHIFDVTNPALPMWLSELHPPLVSNSFVPGQAHEVKVRGNLCASTWLDGGFALHDVTNPAAPVLLSYVKYTNAYCYDAEFNAAGTHLLVTDARSYNGLAIYNITNPAAPVFAGRLPTSGGLMHNVQVKGNYAYISHFQAGLRIANISNPASPVWVGQYDTRPAAASTSATGAYGVFARGTNVFLSDRDNGLYIIDHIDTLAAPLAEYRTGSRTLTVQATSTGAPFAQLTVAGFGPMTYNTSTGIYTLTRTNVNSWPQTVTITSDLGASFVKSVRKR